MFCLFRFLFSKKVVNVTKIIQLQETFCFGKKYHTKTQKTIEKMDGLIITSWKSHCAATTLTTLLMMFELFWAVNSQLKWSVWVAFFQRLQLSLVSHASTFCTEQPEQWNFVIFFSLPKENNWLEKMPHTWQHFRFRLFYHVTSTGTCRKADYYS
jgi:hypothetical protein